MKAINTVTGSVYQVESTVLAVRELPLTEWIPFCAAAFVVYISDVAMTLLLAAVNTK